VKNEINFANSNHIVIAESTIETYRRNVSEDRDDKDDDDDDV